VHPAATYRVVDALIKANKDFDLIVFPDVGHSLPAYGIRRLWDYFVRHLMGAEPPAEYQMITGPQAPGAGNPDDDPDWPFPPDGVSR
jgi:hypothetical protein